MMGTREIFIDSMFEIGLRNINDPCMIFDTLYEVQKLIAKENNVEALQVFSDKFAKCEWYEACSIIRERIEHLKSQEDAVL